MKEYIGWVPTVGRRLSYSVIGDTSHPSIAETANVADEKKRRILCLQERMLLDTALPILKPILARFLFGYNGKFVFFLDAECINGFSSNDQSLIGKLYLFPYKVEEVIDTKISNLRIAINRLNNFYSDGATNDVDASYKKISEDLLSDIDSFSLFNASFRLDRDGIIEISIDTDKDVEYIVCSQFFFFIKDISHRHQHHHPKTDTILDIYCKTTNHWQDEILRALYKKVLDFKRSRDEWVCSSALGILTYIKAFRKVCKNREYEITAFRDDEDLSDSIKVTQTELRYSSSQKIGVRNTFVTITLALLGAMLMLAALGAITDPAIKITLTNNYIKFVSNSILNYPADTILVFFAASLVISVWIYKDYFAGNAYWLKDIVRLSINIKNQVISGALMIVISLLLAASAYIISVHADSLKESLINKVSVIKKLEVAH